MLFIQLILKVEKRLIFLTKIKLSIMKKTIFYIAFFFFFGWINAQNLNKTIEYKPNKLMLLGKVDKNGFKHDDFSWFDKNYKEYLVNDKIVKKLKDSLQNYKIKAFFGTWCGDSRKNLPVFYKVLDKSNFNHKNLEVIAVDRKQEVYKQAPNHEEKGLNIHRVPTFIFYKNGKEVNRIVEHPKETIERDILKIVSGKKYRANYSAVIYLEKLFTEKSIDSIKLIEKGLIGVLPEIAKGTSELNTYGKVTWRANNLEKAKFILELNTKMYPNDYFSRHTLGDFYFEQKDYNKAIKMYYESLSLYPKNEKIKKRILEIEQLTKENNNNLKQ